MEQYIFSILDRYAGWAKENLPGGSLKYLFVYLKICIFKCSYCVYMYIDTYFAIDIYI